MHGCYNRAERNTEFFSVTEGDAVFATFSSATTLYSGHLCSVDTIGRSTGRLAGFTFDRPDLILSNVFPRPAETRPAAHLSPAPVHHV